MRQPWRGHRAPPPSEPESDVDTKKELAALSDVMARLAPPPSAKPGIVAWLSERAGERASVARARLAGLARRAERLGAAGRLAGLPAPLRALARGAAGLCGRGAERLCPTPPGAEQARHLSLTLSALASRPRRMALRETAVEYARDLVGTTSGSAWQIDAEEILAALEGLLNEDADVILLECQIQSLRPGSSGRAAAERAAAESRDRLRRDLLWCGSRRPDVEVCCELMKQANFWAVYAAGTNAINH